MVFMAVCGLTFPVSHMCEVYSALFAQRLGPYNLGTQFINSFMYLHGANKPR